jgi:hypothetical protein
MDSWGVDQGLGGDAPKDNNNMARLVELQRPLGPVAVAKWTVIRFAGGRSLITNDLGYGPLRDSASGGPGMVVPPDPRMSSPSYREGPDDSLSLAPARGRPLSGTWTAPPGIARG